MWHPPFTSLHPYAHVPGAPEGVVSELSDRGAALAADVEYYALAGKDSKHTLTHMLDKQLHDVWTELRRIEEVARKHIAQDVDEMMRHVVEELEKKVDTGSALFFDVEGAHGQEVKLTLKQMVLHCFNFAHRLNVHHGKLLDRIRKAHETIGEDMQLTGEQFQRLCLDQAKIRTAYGELKEENRVLKERLDKLEGKTQG